MRRLALATFVLVLLLWPFAYRYSSFGIDTEQRLGTGVERTFYRIRLPGDGSVFVGSIAEHQSGGGHSAQAFDLGGDFLKPAHPMPAASSWNRLGFWWVDVDASRGDRPVPATPHASRTRLVGVPYWLLVLVAGAPLLPLALSRLRRRKRQLV